MTVRMTLRQIRRRWTDDLVYDTKMMIVGSACVALAPITLSALAGVAIAFHVNELRRRPFPPSTGRERLNRFKQFIPRRMTGIPRPRPRETRAAV